MSDLHSSGIECRDCHGTGKDPEGFFSACRRCEGSGLASDEHCVRCGALGPQCKPFETIGRNGTRTIHYCGID